MALIIDTVADSKKTVDELNKIEKAVDGIARAASKTDKAKISPDVDTKGVDSARSKLERLAATVKGIVASINKVGSQNKEGLSSVNKSLDSASDAGQRLSGVLKGVKVPPSASGGLDDINKSASAAADSSARLGVLLNSAAVAASALGAAAGFVFNVDSFVSLDNRLKSVFNTTGAVKGGLQDIQDITINTRSSLDAIASLYTKVATSTIPLGKSQREIAVFTQTVAQAVSISGSSVQQQQAAIEQLGQALGSNSFAGDELKSVTENALSLAQVIADGLAVDVGMLKTLGATGALTTDKVFRAVLSQSTVLDKKMGKMGVTYSSAFSNIGTALSVLVNRATQLLPSIISPTDLNNIAKAIYRVALSFDSTIIGIKLGLGSIIADIEALPAKVLGLMSSIDPMLMFSGIRLQVEQLLSSARTVAEGIRAIFDSFSLGGVGSWISDLVGGVAFWGEKLNSRSIVGYFTGFANKVSDGFAKLYDDVIGHSFIPDLVEGIGKYGKQLLAFKMPLWLRFMLVLAASFSFGAFMVIRAWQMMIDKIKDQGLAKTLIDLFFNFEELVNSDTILGPIYRLATKIIVLFSSISTTISTSWNAAVNSLLSFESFGDVAEALYNWGGRVAAGMKDALKRVAVVAKDEVAKIGSTIGESINDAYERFSNLGPVARFSQSTLGRDLKQVLGMRERYPGTYLDERVGGRPPLLKSYKTRNNENGRTDYVGRGWASDQESRPFGHDLVNMFSQASQTRIVQGISAAMLAATLLTLRSSIVTQALSALVSIAATVWISRAFDKEVISDASANVANAFRKGLVGIADLIFPEFDPVGYLVILGKLALLIGAARTAMAGGALKMAKAGISLGETVTTKLESGLLSAQRKIFQNFRQPVADRITKQTASAQSLLLQAKSSAGLSNANFAAFTRNVRENNLPNLAGNPGLISAAASIRSADAIRENIRKSTKELNRFDARIASIDENINANKATQSEGRKAFRNATVNNFSLAGGLVGSVLSFKVGDAIAKQMVGYSEWAQVGVQIFSFGVLQFVGASIGGAIAVAMLGALSAIGTALASPIFVIGAAAAGLTAGVVLLYRHWDEIKPVLTSLWDKVEPIFSSVWGGLTSLLNGWLGNLKGVMLDVFGLLQDKYPSVFGTKSDAPDRDRGKIGNLLRDLRVFNLVSTEVDTYAMFGGEGGRNPTSTEVANLRSKLQDKYIQFTDEELETQLSKLKHIHDMNLTLYRAVGEFIRNSKSEGSPASGEAILRFKEVLSKKLSQFPEGAFENVGISESNKSSIWGLSKFRDFRDINRAREAINDATKARDSGTTEKRTSFLDNLNLVTPAFASDELESSLQRRITRGIQSVMDKMRATVSAPPARDFNTSSRNVRALDNALEGGTTPKPSEQWQSSAASSIRALDQSIMDLSESTSVLSRAQKLAAEAVSNIAGSQIERMNAFGAALPTEHRLAAFSDFISRMEGTDKLGYATNFTGTKIGDLSKHPNVEAAFSRIPGKGWVKSDSISSEEFKTALSSRLTTSAAGKHQWQRGTWDDISAKLGLVDFSGASQEAAFKEKLRERGALDSVLSGNFGDATSVLGKEWQSLPQSNSSKSWDTALSRLLQAGNVRQTGSAEQASAPGESKSTASKDSGFLQSAVDRVEGLYESIKGAFSSDGKFKTDDTSLIGKGLAHLSELINDPLKYASKLKDRIVESAKSDKPSEIVASIKSADEMFATLNVLLTSNNLEQFTRTDFDNLQPTQMQELLTMLDQLAELSKSEGYLSKMLAKSATSDLRKKIEEMVKQNAQDRGAPVKQPKFVDPSSEELGKQFAKDAKERFIDGMSDVLQGKAKFMDTIVASYQAFADKSVKALVKGFVESLMTGFFDAMGDQVAVANSIGKKLGQYVKDFFVGSTDSNTVDITRPDESKPTNSDSVVGKLLSALGVTSGDESESPIAKALATANDTAISEGKSNRDAVKVASEQNSGTIVGAIVKSIGALIETIAKLIGSIVSSIGSALTSNGDSGGGIGSLFQMFSGLFGGDKATPAEPSPAVPVFALPEFASGGVIPGLKGLPMPILGHSGEIVLNAAQQSSVASRINGKEGGTTVSQTSNIYITGDVSRQTRATIMQLIPTIAAGVNAYNAQRGGVR